MSWIIFIYASLPFYIVAHLFSRSCALSPVGFLSHPCSMLPGTDLAALTIVGQALSQYTPTSRWPQPARLHMHHGMHSEQNSQARWESSHSFLLPGESSDSSIRPLPTQWATTMGAQQAHSGSATSVSPLHPSSRTFARTKRMRDVQRQNPKATQMESASPLDLDRSMVAAHSANSIIEAFKCSTT